MKIIYLMLLLFISTTLFAQQADDVIGKYHLPNGIDIKIYKVEDSYNGKIIALNEYPETKDKKNPNKSKRKELLLGKVIIKNLKFDTDEKKWNKGKMYGPDKGINVNLEITASNNDEMTIVVSKFIFWKTLKWKRINN